MLALGCAPPGGKYDLAWACAPGAIAEIADDFDDGKTSTSWTPYPLTPGAARAFEADGALQLHFDGGKKSDFAGYEWRAAPRSLRDCEASIQVKATGAASPGIVTYFIVNDFDAPAGQQEISFTQAGANLLLHVIVDGSTASSRSIAYDAAAQKWWRIREAAGTTFFETSPDGSAWKIAHSASTPAFAGHATINIGMGGPNPPPANGFAGATAVFDDLNIAP